MIVAELFGVLAELMAMVKAGAAIEVVLTNKGVTDIRQSTIKHN